MSRAVVNEILDTALLDEEFRHAIESDPEGFLAGYDLTDDERAALTTRNFKKATELAGGPQAGLTFVRIFVTTINNNNLVAIRPEHDQERKQALRARGEEIARSSGDRTESIKELLAQMR